MEVRELVRENAAAFNAMVNSVCRERVELEVYAGNAPAVRLYEWAGFVREGRKRRARKLDGVYEDILLMARFAGTEAESVTETT